MYGNVYSEWQDLMNAETVGNGELVKAVDAIGLKFVNEAVKSIDSRIKPYMPYLLRSELGLRDDRWSC